MGRPSSYTEEIAEEICSRLEEGEPLRAICRDDHMPARRTVDDWRVAMPAFAARIARARSIGFDAIAEEALQIADTPMEGVEITTDERGTSEKRGDMLGHRKLQVETRLKLLAKWDPKRYGDKLAIGGADDLPPLKTMGDDALAERIKQLQEKVNGKG